MESKREPDGGVPHDADDDINYFRQRGSHALDNPALDREAAMSRRLLKEMASWTEARVLRTFSEGANEMSLRFVSPLQVIGAVVINDETSPYRGGLFFFEFLLPEVYPFKPPRVRLLTRCYHFAVSECGTDPGCLDLVHDNWAPQHRLRKVFEEFVNVLLFKQIFTVNTFMPEIRKEYKHRRAEFDAKARLWTQWYAHGDIPFGWWTRENHRRFPAWMRRRVVVWLLVHVRKKKEFCAMPRDVALLVCPFICTADAFDAERDKVLGPDDPYL